jgi:hypothetical protein
MPFLALTYFSPFFGDNEGNKNTSKIGHKTLLNTVIETYGSSAHLYPDSCLACLAFAKMVAPSMLYLYFCLMSL